MLQTTDLKQSFERLGHESQLQYQKLQTQTKAMHGETFEEQEAKSD